MGSSGGGGGSGKADWPDYMKTKHGEWLTEIDVLIAAGIAANPYTGLTAYDPDVDLTAMATAIGAFDTYIDGLDTNFVTAAITATYGDVAVELAATAVPAFEAGMDNINSIQSTAFVTGEAALYAVAASAAAKEGSRLWGIVAQILGEGKKAVAAMTVEANRMKIVAKGEEEGRQTELDVHEATWPLELYMYGGNMLGSIGGGHSGTVAKPPSKTQSALGGAMAGAGTGAMIGSMGPQATVGGTLWGAAIGAVIGGVGGYIAGS
jgi:hypothetical protein